MRHGADVVTKDQHISLVALWAEWHHRGKLSARVSMCYFVSINCDAFSHCAQKYNGPLFRFLHIFGVLLIGQIEAMDDEGLVVTDLGLSDERQSELSIRAQGFVSLVENSRGRRNTSQCEAVLEEWIVFVVTVKLVKPAFLRPQRCRRGRDWVESRVEDCAALKTVYLQEHDNVISFGFRV